MTAFQSEDAFAELWYTVSASRGFYAGTTANFPSWQLKAIKLAVGVTPTCWRPPFGDVDDRIRAIAKGLGLRTILWQYDSNDWQVGATAGVTPQQVDSNYQSLIQNAKSGLFNSVSLRCICAWELTDRIYSKVLSY